MQTLYYFKYRSKTINSWTIKHCLCLFIVISAYIAKSYECMGFISEITPKNVYKPGDKLI